MSLKYIFCKYQETVLIRWKNVYPDFYTLLLLPDPRDLFLIHNILSVNKPVLVTTELPFNIIPILKGTIKVCCWNKKKTKKNMITCENMLWDSHRVFSHERACWESGFF